MSKDGITSIEVLKADYVSYYEDVPIQKYASMYVGRNEDTIIRWKKQDSVFADAIQRAKASWIRKKVVATKAEFALERLEREIFARDIVPSPDAERDAFAQKMRAFMDDTDDLAYDEATISRAHSTA